MKRDADLIRTLLYEIEKKIPGHMTARDFFVEGPNTHKISYHLRLPDEAGFIRNIRGSLLK